MQVYFAPSASENSHQVDDRVMRFWVIYRTSEFYASLTLAESLTSL